MPEYEIDVTEGADVMLEDGSVRVSGPKGELRCEFIHPYIKVRKKDGKIVLSSESGRKKIKAMMGTWRALLKNMMAGVTRGYSCEMKLVYAHFPVKLEVKDGTLVIRNFLGEKSTRYAEIIRGVDIKIDGDTVKLSGIDKKKVGQTAANIEQATKVKGFDRRVFQDGIYVTQKAAPSA